MKNVITSQDPKILEFLVYLGVDLELCKDVVITVPLEGVVIIEETRMAEKADDDH